MDHCAVATKGPAAHPFWLHEDDKPFNAADRIVRQGRGIDACAAACHQQLFPPCASGGECRVRSQEDRSVPGKVAERFQPLVSRRSGLAFLLFSLYLLVAAATITHRQLFLAEPVKLPVLNIELPLVGFLFPDADLVRSLSRLCTDTGDPARAHGDRI